MNRRSANSGIFLIELVIAILVFAVCAAVCMRVFADARLMTQESLELSRGVMEAESAAECYKAANGDLAGTAALYGGTLTDPHTLTASFDKGWTFTEEDARYLLTIEAGENGYAQISVSAVPSAGGEARSIFLITVKAVV